MKSIVLFLILTSIGCQISRKQSNLVNRTQAQFEVKKIDSINNYYLIYLIKDRSRLKIVSKKRLQNTIPCENKIIVGKKYFFQLEQLILRPINNSNPLTNKPSMSILSCYLFDDDTKICEEEEMETLYKAENLDGLCVIK